MQATSEWRDIPEILKLTFKGVCHVLKHQHESMSELKAQVAAKTNLADMKRTMTEVAQNIEQRVTYEDY